MEDVLLVWTMPVEIDVATDDGSIHINGVRVERGQPYVYLPDGRLLRLTWGE